MHGQSVSVAVLNFCSNVYIAQDKQANGCKPYQNLQTKT